MREARERIEEGLKRRGLDFPVLLQGEGSRTELLERFRRLGNAVLLKRDLEFKDAARDALQSAPGNAHASV